MYVPVGPGDDPISDRVYVGEGDVVALRLQQHAKDKEFWNLIVAFTKSDATLNKAHVRYLEAELVGLAREAGRAEIDNGTEPRPPSPPEAELADLRAFLRDIRHILRILGITAFEKPSPPIVKSGAGANDSDVANVYQMTIGSVTANGRQTSDGFLVLKGSQANINETPTISPGYKAIRQTLRADGTLVEAEPGELKFTRDHLFRSPSAAAAAVYGGQISGPQHWKFAGKTLKELEEESLSKAQPTSEADDEGVAFPEQISRFFG